MDYEKSDRLFRGTSLMSFERPGSHNFYRDDEL
jgi:hypothetical protein